MLSWHVNMNLAHEGWGTNMNMSHGHDHLSYGHEVWGIQLPMKHEHEAEQPMTLDMNMKDMDWRWASQLHEGRDMT